MVAFVSLLILSAITGCAVNRSENNSRQGTGSNLNLNDPRVHFLGSYDGSSTGARVLLVGGSPSDTAAEKRAKSAAIADAIKKGIKPSSLRFVNANQGKSGVPLLVAGFKTVSVSIEAYYIDDEKLPTVSAPIVSTAVPPVNK